MYKISFEAPDLNDVDRMAVTYAKGVEVTRILTAEQMGRAQYHESVQASLDKCDTSSPASAPTEAHTADPVPEAPKQKRTRKISAPDTVAQAASKVDGVPSAEAPVTDSQAQVDNSASTPSVTPAEAKEPETAGDKTGVVPPAPAVVVTFDDMKAKLQAVAAHFGGDEGLEKVSAIISKFGARKIKEVPADKYAEIVAECEAVLK
jgi:hypothetical protein